MPVLALVGWVIGLPILAVILIVLVVRAIW